MQEAFGGTFMLKLFMIFFIIYVSFIGVALNFAKIYRIKNNVINILEQYQYSGKTTDGDNIDSKLSEYLVKVPYQFIPTNSNEKICFNRANEGQIDKNLFKTHGICVIKKGDADKPYYSVTVYHLIEFPVLDVYVPITASGETIVIDTE